MLVARRPDGRNEDNRFYAFDIVRERELRDRVMIQSPTRHHDDLVGTNAEESVKCVCYAAGSPGARDSDPRAGFAAVMDDGGALVIEILQCRYHY